MPFADYEKEVAIAKARLQMHLHRGKSSASELAVVRRTFEIMETEVRWKLSVLIYDKLSPDKDGLKSAQRWHAESIRKAGREINPEYLPPDAYLRKANEYNELAERLVKDAAIRPKAVVDKKNGKSYLIHGNDPLVPAAMKAVASELTGWFRSQPNSKPVMSMSALAGLATMLSERPDLVMLIRMVQNLPLDAEINNIPVDRPAAVQLATLGIALIPVIGNAVAAYEAYSGQDIFGYRLGDVERGILGASVLLPIAGRLFKGGRALYTEARLVSLYGRDAATWSKVSSASVKAESAAAGKALRDLEQSGVKLRVSKKLADQAAQDASATIPAIANGSASIPAFDPDVIKLLVDLQSSHAALKSLDAPSLLRILEKGPNADHLKGQLLEELVESRLVPMLRDRSGSFALGLSAPTGKKLEFIPGHLIRDGSGRQITDGLLAYRDNIDLHILAVFEVKAGKAASRELGHTKGSVSSLTKDELSELRAAVRDMWRDRRVEARLEGRKYTEKLEDIFKEYLNSEKGGQIRRDIERLVPSGGGSSVLRIGSERLRVNFSPGNTKFFGVIPGNVSTKGIEKHLKDEGIKHFEILGVDIKDSELKSLAEKMRPLAQKLADAP